MLKSMTGFSRARVENDAHEVVVEIRTVNHRYLDVRTRGSAGLTTVDKKVRDRLAQSLGRGKVDVSLYLKPKGESTHQIEVDRPLLSEFVRVTTHWWIPNCSSSQLSQSSKSADSMRVCPAPYG